MDDITEISIFSPSPDEGLGEVVNEEKKTNGGELAEVFNFNMKENIEFFSNHKLLNLTAYRSNKSNEFSDLVDQFW